MTAQVTAGAHRVLTALVVGAYALAVAALVVWATALHWDREPVPRWSVGLAFLVVAATLPAVYRWVDPAVYDLLHGQDGGVGAVLAGLDPGLEISAEPTAVLGGMAASALRLLRIPHVGIEIWPEAGPPDGIGAGSETGWAEGLTARRGTPVAGADELIVPAVYRGEAVGQLLVGGRRARLPLSDDDRRLAVDVARHVALVVSTARLGEALQRSRRHLVVAAEEERRRIRRDLHDGLGPTLASLKLQLAALRRTLDGAKAGAAGSCAIALDDLDATVAEAAADIRRLVDGLRPPMLDDLGLVEALRHLRFVPATLHLTVVEDGPLGGLPAAVEVALYRVAVEAVHNTVRHARAGTCVVHLRRDSDPDQVVVTVSDDGTGHPDGDGWGLGRRTMQERIDELGGRLTTTRRPGEGTAVTAAVPLAPATIPEAPAERGP